MAKYNEILVGRYNQALQKIFGIKGGAPAPQLGGDIQVSFSIFSGVENRFPERWFRYSNAFDQVATPGLTTAARIRNPGNSGAIAVIESIRVWSAAAQDIQVRQRDVLTDVDLGSNGPGLSLERRTGSPRQTFSTLHQSQDFAGNQQGTIVYLIPMPAGGSMFELIQNENQELVVDPGQWFNFFNSLANTRWALNLTWRERMIEEGEVL